ncbi:hypothetical protein [Pseudolysinimonas yzui]|uniref:Lipoprotein n=1 Tax=Pseudolysinimonas yzui TaxID=2708254 RepID=A0A8J3GMJ2_9MICO|nr:hypothetical protein [Pseudolysinimonas yzui]GHF03886.1 hypothetical protein GCM10011600_00210 [Pseudolysinimonas yzui]
MRTLVGTVALAGVLLLAGCDGGTPIPTLPPTPSATPIFASEEEALAAAEQAYEAYREMSDLISGEGGVEPERIAPYVTDDRLTDELRGFQTLREAGLRIAGEATFKVLDLQRYEEVAGDAEVVFYACSDLSGSRVLDANGVDVTPVDRVDRLVLEVVVRTVGGSKPLLLESDNSWPGETC